MRRKKLSERPVRGLVPDKVRGSCGLFVSFSRLVLDFIVHIAAVSLGRLLLIVMLFGPNRRAPAIK